MCLKFEIFVAKRYLSSKASGRFFSLINIFSMMGIAIGVMSLIVITSIMNGVRHEIVELVTGLNGDILIHGKLSETNHEELIKIFGNNSEITSISSLVKGHAMALAGNNSNPVIINGISVNNIKQRSRLMSSITGNLDNFNNDNKSIIIGSMIARSLNVKIGDNITLIVPSGRKTILGSLPAIRNYRIVGIFSLGMPMIDGYHIFMPISQAQKHLMLGRNFNITEIFLHNRDNAKNIADDIASQSFIRNLNLYVSSWQSSNASILSALKIQRNAMFLILSLIIIVAAFNIVSALTMLVYNKKSEIAILRSMGATKNMILRLFVITGGIIGLVGTMAGLVLGVLIGDNVEQIRLWLEKTLNIPLLNDNLYYLSGLPSKLDYSEITLICIGSLIISLLATIYPAHKASSMRPTEILRHD